MATPRTREFLSEWFVAKITAIGSIVGSAPCNGVPHSWTTVTPCPDYSNVWVDPYFPVITGTATAQPAYALDGLAAVVGDIVFMRLRGTPGGMNVYEFQRISGRAQWSSGAGAPSGGLNGDWYYDTTGRRVYERVAGVWVVRTIPQWSSGAGAPGAGTGADTDWYWDTTNKKAYERVAGTWVFRFDSRLQWSSGSGAPSGGFDGDWYYRTSSNTVYEKVAGVWTLRSMGQWSSGTGAPSGGASGNWYFRTDTGYVYENVAGVWTDRSVSTPVVTAITCVSGVLTVTTKTLVTFGSVT